METTQNGKNEHNSVENTPNMMQDTKQESTTCTLSSEEETAINSIYKTILAEDIYPIREKLERDGVVNPDSETLMKYVVSYYKAKNSGHRTSKKTTKKSINKEFETTPKKKKLRHDPIAQMTLEERIIEETPLIEKCTVPPKLPLDKVPATFKTVYQVLLTPLKTTASRQAEETTKLIKANKQTLTDIKRYAGAILLENIKRARLSANPEENIKKELLMFVAKTTKLPYTRSNAEAIVFKRNCAEGFSDEYKTEIECTVNKQADVTILIGEMFVMLSSDLNLRLEAKRNYIKYRYGLLSGDYNNALIRCKSEYDAPEVVLKLLTAVKCIGLSVCFRRAVEHPSDFVAITTLKESRNFLAEYKWLLHYVVTDCNTRNQADILGIDVSDDLCQIYDNKRSFKEITLGERQTLVDIDMVEKLLRETVTASESIKDEESRHDTINKKREVYLKYLRSHIKKYSEVHQVINPEILKVILYTKPLHGLVSDHTVKAGNAESFKHPDKMFSKISGAVDMHTTCEKYTDSFNSQGQGDSELYSKAVDPFMLKVYGHKKVYEKLYVPPKGKIKEIENLKKLSTKKFKLKEMYNGNSYLEVKLNDVQNEASNALLDYLEEVRDTARYDLCLKMGAYPERVWRKFSRLVTKHRGAIMQERLSPNGPDKYELRPLDLYDLLDLQEVTPQEEQALLMCKGAITYSIDHNITSSVSPMKPLLEPYCNYLKDLFDTSRFLVAVAMHEINSRSRDMQPTRASETAGKTIVRTLVTEARRGKYTVVNNKLQLVRRTHQETELFDNNTGIRQLENVKLLYWDCIIARYDTRLPQLFYGLDTRAIATVCQHHDFAENFLSDTILDSRVHSLTSVHMPKKVLVQSYDYNKSRVSYLISKCKTDFPKVGLYAASTGSSTGGTKLTTPAYRRWFKEYKKYFYENLVKKLRLSDAPKYSSICNMMNVPRKKEDSKRRDLTMRLYYVTDKRLCLDEAQLTCHTCTQQEVDNRRSAIGKVVAIKQEIKELTAKISELQNELTVANIVQGSRPMAVIRDELQKAILLVNEKVLLTKNSLSRSKAENDKLRSMRVTTCNNDIRSIILNSMLMLFSESLKKYRVNFHLDTTCIAQSTEQSLAKLLNIVINSAEFSDLQYSDIMTQIDIIKLQTDYNVTLPYSGNDQDVLNCLALYKYLHVAKVLSRKLADFITAVNSVNMSMAQVVKYTNEHDSVKAVSTDVAKAYALRVRRSKISKRELGQIIFKKALAGINAHMKDVVDVTELVVAPLLRSPKISTSDIEAYRDYVSYCLQQVDAIPSGDKKYTIELLKKEVQDIRDNLSISELDRDLALVKLLKPKFVKLAILEKHEHMRKNSIKKQKRNATSFCDENTSGIKGGSRVCV